MDVNQLIEGCKLHNNPMVEWIIIYLLNNPKTDFECPVLNKAFEAQFPDEYAIDVLETLYRQGIANKYAMREYYIDNTSISIIEGRRKIIALTKAPDDTPIWDFTY